MTFQELRQKHPKFIYQGFELSQEGEDLKVRFNFLTIPEIEFKPEIIFHSVPKEKLARLDKNVLHNLIFNLGMMEMFSYWKATCSPEIIIEAGYLDDDQLKWWQNLLREGLGEFYFTNRINFLEPDLVKMTVSSGEKYSRFEGDLPDNNLVLVGGGKDSAVTLEIIAKSGEDFNCLLLSPTKASGKMAQVGGCSSPIIISRTIYPKLLELNKEGYLNGHTPFSTYLAFLSVASAVIYGYKTILVSNEASSNEGNIEYLGKQVNHQISKSYHFEKMFEEYSKKYLAGKALYFSFLRPLFELQIAKIFAKMPQYHQLFRSCNKGSKTGIWCLDCPKCLFAALVLYPFIDNKIIEIFGRNILDEDKFMEMGKSLIGVGGNLKPFDCVGTHQESKAAVYLGVKKAQSLKTVIPKVLQVLRKLISENDQQMEINAENVLKNWNEENNLPKKYEDLLRKELNEN